MAAVTIVEYPAAPSSFPYSIITGPDGNLWFTEFTGNKIGKITTSGAITEYSIPTANSGPRGITTGPNGNLWFAEYSGNNIGTVEISSNPNQPSNGSSSSSSANSNNPTLTTGSPAASPPDTGYGLHSNSNPIIFGITSISLVSISGGLALLFKQRSKAHIKHSL